jgi:hypothetical protein
MLCADLFFFNEQSNKIKIMIYIIYAVGFIATWIACKIARGTISENNQWNDISKTFFLAIFSWIGLIIIFILWVYWKITNDITMPKPPRWL